MFMKNETFPYKKGSQMIQYYKWQCIRLLPAEHSSEVGPCKKVLGLIWNYQTDELLFSFVKLQQLS